jgi:mannosyltransferase OCH1-like enzyme
MGMGEGEGEGEGVKPKLFQFWNTERAPDEVEVLMQTWAEDPQFEYHRFRTETADAFIAANFDRRTLAAYRKCGVPAMQADFFRYCALYVHGGVYVDADTKNSGRLPELLKGRVRGLLMTRETRVANDFLYVCEPKEDLYLEVIKVAVDNIERENSNNVWAVTGPGIMTQFFHKDETKHLVETFELEPARVVREYVLFQHALEYKKSDDDWRKNLKDFTRTIFTG